MSILSVFPKFFRILILAGLVPTIYVQAATFSVLPLDGGNDFQSPADASLIVFDQLTTGIGPDDTFERDVKSNRDNAQTFTLGVNTTIDRLAINFLEAPLTTDETTFEFFTVTDPEASTLQPLSILDTVTFASSDLGTSAGTLIFDVVDTPATSGSSFGIRFDTAASTELVFKWNFVANEYSDAGRYEGGNLNANDHYTVGVIAVPEPSTLVLFGIAVGTVLALRKPRT